MQQSAFKIPIRLCSSQQNSFPNSYYKISRRESLNVSLKLGRATRNSLFAMQIPPPLHQRKNPENSRSVKYLILPVFTNNSITAQHLVAPGLERETSRLLPSDLTTRPPTPPNRSKRQINAVVKTIKEMSISPIC